MAQSGVLVIDKPQGPTSHDVVSRLRRVLKNSRIGHCGTLDPMATGVLVILVGEATKLGPYLTMHDKRYVARIVFGTATDTLDAEGKVLQTTAIPSWMKDELAAIHAHAGWLEQVEQVAPQIMAAVARECSRRRQAPPAYSAIKVGGQRSYVRARAQEVVDLEEREVKVRSMVIVDGHPGADDHGPFTLTLCLDVSKGYYVRALARDLGADLGVAAHLGSLRRVSSGPFTLEMAMPLDEARQKFVDGLMPIQAAAARSLPLGQLTARGAELASTGRKLGEAEFLVCPRGSTSAWLDPQGRLVAVGTEREGTFVVLRGFADPRAESEKR